MAFLDLVASMSSIQSAALRDTLPLLHHPSELQSPTTEGFTVQQRLADLFRQYDSSVHAPASDSDSAEYSGTPRDANRVTPANAAETLAVIIGSHHQRAAAGSSNSAAAKGGGKLEISLAEKAALMCDTVREWGKPFSPSQPPPQTTLKSLSRKLAKFRVAEGWIRTWVSLVLLHGVIPSAYNERGGDTENPGPIPHRTGGGSEEASMEAPSLVFPPYLALGIGRPVPLSILAMYFESFGEADFLDCTRMLTESSDPYAIRLSFFDRRVTEQVYQRLRGASSDDPRCAAISRAGPSSQLAAESGGGAPMEIIAITSCIMVDVRSSRLRGAADPRVVDVEQLCWSLPEAVDCCSEFGALASANGRPVSRLIMQASELCRATTVTSSDNNDAMGYLTSQVARSLARFYRAVGVSDYRGARVPSSASLTAIQATVPSPRAAAAATSPVVSVPGMEESLHITEVEGGLANRTTVMVRNIPPAYTSSRLLQEILETLLEQAGEDELAAVNAAVGAPFGIDFVYLPFNLKNRAGVSSSRASLATFSSSSGKLWLRKFNDY
ncbi:hypothetical protein FOZ62_029082 [Perkinsus olseni]|uniref:Uncharacterized protein n=1 Tax=Perkinsus olseni TaxID=32597 RepID=A0A7J6UER3_PEROL|nr:hypothetical protein FOZ62_029082 [Perkinsus olseni]